MREESTKECNEMPNDDADCNHETAIIVVSEPLYSANTTSLYQTYNRSNIHW